MSKRKISVLVIDDDMADAEIFHHHLMKTQEWVIDYSYIDRPDSTLLAQRIKDDTIVFSDYMLNGQTGLELLRTIRTVSTLCPIIMLTGQGDEDVAVKSMRLGACDYLTKDNLSLEVIEKSMRHALEKLDSEMALRNSHKQLLNAIQSKNTLLSENDKLIRWQNIAMERLGRIKKQLEKEKSSLEIANERLAKLDELKSKFISNVSHELRTPLTVLKTTLSNFLDGTFGQIAPLHTKWIGIMGDNVDHLTRLINDILDLAKLESGSYVMVREKFDITQVLRRVHQRYLSLAQKKDLKLVYEGPESPSVMVGDEKTIEQVVTNLLGNALKFTPAKGKITISLAQEKERFHVSVTDTGCGIEPDKLELVFDRFYQAQTKVLGAAKGTGLGLSICREIISLHRGRIWVESTKGEGTSFHIKLPVNFDDSSESEEEKNRILIVDDDKSVCRACERSMKRLGFNPTVMRDGAKAIDFIKNDRGQYQVAIVDLKLPGVSGVEVIRELKKFHPETFVVLVTGHPESSLFERALGLGPMCVIPKPFDVDQIKKMTASFVNMKK